MAGTGTSMSWTGAAFTPLSGSILHLNKCTSCDLDLSSTIEEFKGDIDRFARVKAAPSLQRNITIDIADVAAALLIPKNTPGTFIITLADPLGGITTGGGALLVTLTPCICSGTPVTGDHAKFASVKLTFEGYAPDGSTDPLTVAAV